MDGGVRLATTADGPQIADIHVASWRVTYRDLLPRHYIERLDRDRLALEWTRRLARGGGGETVLVASRDRIVTGFVAFGPSRDRDEVAGFAGEVTMLYVRPELEGMGIGGRLLESALAELAAEPRYWVVIWVLESNTAAIEFYRLHGLELDGARRIDPIGGGRTRVVRCAAPLNRAIDFEALTRSRG